MLLREDGPDNSAGAIRKFFSGLPVPFTGKTQECVVQFFDHVVARLFKDEKDDGNDEMAALPKRIEDQPIEENKENSDQGLLYL